MLSELTYVGRPDGTGIPDDSVPVLRFNCVRLALFIGWRMLVGSG